MTERTENIPNIQGLNFSSPNRFVVSPKSPSIKSESPQIINLGVGKRQYRNQTEENKLIRLTYLLKMMYQWQSASQAINEISWIDAELRKYLIEIDKRFQRLYFLQRALQRAFNFNDIVERGNFYNDWILGITEMTNQRKIFGLACEDHHKFQTAIGNAQISEAGMNLSRKIDEQHLQSQILTSLNKLLRQDLMRLKQQNSTNYRQRVQSYQSELNTLKIEQVYEKVKQQLRKSNQITNHIQTLQPASLQLHQKNNKTESLESQNAELSRNHRLLQDQLSNYKTKLNIEEQRISQNQTIIKTQQQNLQNANNQIKYLQIKISELQRQNYQLNDRLFIQSNNPNRLKQQISNVTSKFLQVRNKLQQKQQNECKLIKKIQQLEQSRRSSHQISLVYVKEGEQLRLKYEKSQSNVNQLSIQNKQLSQKIKQLSNQIQFENNNKINNPYKGKAEAQRNEQLQLSDQSHAKQLQTLKAQLSKQKANNEIIRKSEANELRQLRIKYQEISKSQKQKQQQLQKLKVTCLSLQAKQTVFSAEAKKLQQQNRYLKQYNSKTNEVIQQKQQNLIRIAQLVEQVDYHKASAKRYAQQKLKIDYLYANQLKNQNILQQQLFNLRKAIPQKQLIIQNMQKSILNLQQQLKNQNSSQSLIKILSNRIKQTEQQQNKTVYQLNQQKAQKSKLQQKISKYKQEIQYLNKQIEMLNKILEQKNESSIIRHQKQDKQNAKESKDSLGLMSSKIASLQEKLKMKDGQILQFKEKYQQKDALLSQIQQQNRTKEQQISKLSQEINQIMKISNNLKQQMQNILAKHTLQKKQLQAQLSKINFQSSIINKDPNNFNHINLLFQHQILYDQYDKKQYLTKVIEKQMRKQIMKTRLLFTYDPLNKTNFHMYIDEKINIVFIIKLVNGNYVAAYSEGIFKPKYSSKDVGIIISLTNKKYFTLADPSKKAIIYDEYFIIFGNSQIRLKSQQNLLFSNFGISNAHYNAKGQKVNVLLGQGASRQVALQSYEIYQITFDN